LRHAKGEIIALLNDDTEVRPDWLRNLVRHLQTHPRVGLVGSLILEPDGEHIQHIGCRLLFNYLNQHLGRGDTISQAPPEPVDRDYIMGAAITLRKNLLEALGGLAECYFPGYYEDLELCYRIRALGHQIQLVPSAIVVHREKQTVRSDRDYFRIYHRNRWQFILRNLPASEVFRAVLAELVWVARITRWRDFRHHRPLLYSYARTLFRLPALLAARYRLRRENRKIKEKTRKADTP